MLYVLFEDGTRIPIEPFNPDTTDPGCFVPVAHLPVMLGLSNETSFVRENALDAQITPAPNGSTMEPSSADPMGPQRFVIENSLDAMSTPNQSLSVAKDGLKPLKLLPDWFA